MKTTHHISRRHFLKAASTFTVAAPFILPSHVWGADVAPSERITMGFVGVGKQGRDLLNNFLRQNNTKVLAICDVDTTRRDSAKERVNTFYSNSDCATHTDFRELIARKDLDTVCIATPDHWHAFITLAALKAGKDVYCEKPLTHNIHEAVAVMKSVPAHKRILQCGSMQRSSSEFRVACELVRNGVIGKISHVECNFGDPGRPCDLPEQAMEPGLDWDRWCGPGPLRGYNSILSPRGIPNNFPDWRLYKEYGSGAVGDWGAHHLDIAQWGLGMDDSGPVEAIPPEDPHAKRGAKLVYASGIFVQQKDGVAVVFYGSDGIVRVDRGKFELVVGDKTMASFMGNNRRRGNADASSQPETTLGAELKKAETQYLANAPVKLYVSRNHLADFLQCVKSRKKSITNEQVGCRSAICVHLTNQCYYHHATLKWDPAKFKFVGGTGDKAWMTRDYRKPWVV
jgi:predicted dehydrogenase